MLLTTAKGKFMLTMFPLELIKQYADNNGWVSIKSHEPSLPAGTIDGNKKNG